MQKFTSKPESTGIIAWFARNSVAANLLMMGVILVGLFSVDALRKEAFPSLEPNRVTVSVNYDSGDSVQSEEGIAIKIEEALETVAGIKHITSTSNATGTRVTIEKETSYDLDTLFEDIQIKVNAINNLPQQAEAPIIEKARMQDHAIWVQVYGNADRNTLQNLAEQVKADLLAQSAISDLTIKAQIDPMISVEVNENMLQAYGLTITDISNAINKESATAISTSLRDENKTVRLKASEQLYEIEDFKAIPIMTTADGSRITLGDLATVRETFEEDTLSVSRYNQQHAMGIQVLMDEHSDVVKVVEQSKAVVEKWQNSDLLPQGVEITTWYDKSGMIKERLSLLLKNALTGIALVFIVLAIFLNIRVAFWVAASLPFVCFGTLYFMTDSFLGLTINEMTTFGFIMALGIVVDDAVVIGESVYSTKQEQGDSMESTIRGVQRVAAPTIFGVLTTVAAFLSIAAVDGMIGQVYAQFGTVVVVCLLLSLIESKCILPSHLAHVKTQTENSKGIISKIQQTATFGLDWFNQHIYKKVISLALEFRYAVILGFIALFILVIGMPMTGAVKISFFPDVSGDTVTAQMSMYNDTSFGQTQNNLARLETNAIAVDKALSNTSYITSIQVVAEKDKIGSVQVELAANATYSAADFARLWRSKSEQMEGVKKLKVLSMHEMTDNFKVEIKGSNETELLSAGNQFKAALQAVKGVSGIDDNLDLGEPQYRFELNEQGRALGMDSASLSKQVLQSFGGDIVQRFQRGKNEVKVRVRYPESDRRTLANIMQSSVRTPSNKVVPLAAIAHVHADYQQSEITRIDNLRAIYLTAVVDKSVLSSNALVSQMQNSVVQDLLSQYPNLKIDFTGEAEQQKESTDSMSASFVLALIAIYALLAIPLKSYVQPLLIMIAIPFGIVGAILGHWVNDLSLGILSLNGILALSGVVVNDSLLLVSRYNELKENMSVTEAIVEACSGRLRAVMLTSVTTFAGLAPLLGETSMQAQFLIPAAASLGYGILFATVVTLILTPSMLMILNDAKRLLAVGLRFQTRIKAERLCQNQ